MTTLDVAVAPIVAGNTVTLRLKGVRVVQARMRLGAAILKLAGHLLPCAVEVVTDDPPATSYDVAVEKVGGQIRLRIGDRGVRLDRMDAKHIGGLLECGWVGTAYGMRADDVADEKGAINTC